MSNFRAMFCIFCAVSIEEFHPSDDDVTLNDAKDERTVEQLVNKNKHCFILAHVSDF